jgi:hypothetical protein
MPKNGNSAFKRAVRARMAETGEPYNVVRRKLLAEREAKSDTPDARR